MTLVKSTSSSASRLRFEPSAGTTSGKASITGMVAVAVGWTRETSGQDGAVACCGCGQDGLSQALSGREDKTGDGSLSTVIGPGGDFRRFTAVVSEAAGDWRSVGVGLFVVVLERGTGDGFAVVEDRSRSFRRAC